MVGSPVAGVVVTLVALTKGAPWASPPAPSTSCTRFVEDYLLNPEGHEAHGQGLA